MIGVGFRFEKEVIMKFIIVMLGILLMTDAGTCLAIDQSICKPGSENSFHPNGKLKTCILEEDAVINDVHCTQYEPVTLYQSERLESCVLSEYFNYNAITCKEHSQISLYATGILHTCILSKTIQIDGKTCEQLKPVSLFEDGKLKSCSTPL